MAKKVEELPPAPPLPGAPHTVHTDELVKALGANPVKGFSDAQAQELQSCVPSLPWLPSLHQRSLAVPAADRPSHPRLPFLQQIWAEPAEAAGEAVGQFALGSIGLGVSIADFCPRSPL